MYSLFMPASWGKFTHIKLDKQASQWIAYSLFIVSVFFCLYLVVGLYAQQQFAFAILVLLVVTSLSWVVVNKKAQAARYIYPSLFGMGVFVIFPLVYTISVGFTNYSAANLLTYERAQEVILAETITSTSQEYPFSLYRQGEQHYSLELKGQDVSFFADWQQANSNTTLPLTLSSNLAIDAKPLSIKEIIQLRKELDGLSLTLPDGTQLSKSGLRKFAAITPRYTVQGEGQLFDTQRQEILTANHELGVFQRPDGEAIAPGFKVYVGLDNFTRVITDENIRNPFLQIFVWTITFAAVTVVFVMAIGLVLANLMQWKPLKGKKAYRLLLILPYAVPAFISILMFKGLFNQNFGEINMVLDMLFGIKPAWFSNEAMAKTMLLIVNVWLGFPYFMLLCSGLIQSIPEDLYEASALDGAGPIDNLLKITLPLVIKPLTPLLIAAFAFNFNNFVVISLLTEGNPDIIGASTPAGTTDLLVSYTYRIAFQDSGQNFGLAAAISTLIFIVVGALALLNLKLTKVTV